MSPLNKVQLSFSDLESSKKASSKIDDSISEPNRPTHVSTESTVSTSQGPSLARPELNQSQCRAEENTREFWLNSGQDILKESLQKEMNKNVAKNLIILVADGMSIPTQMATRMYMGGEEKVLSFERFPYVGLAKVRREKFPFE